MGRQAYGRKYAGKETSKKERKKERRGERAEQGTATAAQRIQRILTMAREAWSCRRSQRGLTRLTTGNFERKGREDERARETKIASQSGRRRETERDGDRTRKRLRERQGDTKRETGRHQHR